MPAPQEKRILAHLQNVGPLTQKRASEELGVGRLSERIRDLEAAGQVIKHERITVTNQYGNQHVTEYTLVSSQERMTL